MGGALVAGPGIVYAAEPRADLAQALAAKRARFRAHPRR
jgi:hypothetical protein